jgi:hypothetical protein
MSEADDVGLPEEASGKLEQTNAVPVNENGPWRRFSVSGPLQIFQNLDDMYEYGSDIVMNYGRKYKIFIVLENLDSRTVYNLLYPNQPHYWVVEKFPPDPVVLLDNPDQGPDLDFSPLYERMVEWAEQGVKSDLKPKGSVQVSTYKGVPVYLPDPTLDYSRPESQTEATTGAATGTTVQTTTTKTPGTAGSVTTSETTPAEVGLDAFGGAGSTVSRSDPLDAFGGAGSTVSRSDPLDAFGGAGDAAAAQNASVAGGRGNGAAEVAQRQANAAVSRTTASAVATGTAPCLPNNPPASSGAGTSGSTPPAVTNYDDAILRQARANSAAPASTAGGGRGNGQAELAQRRADATAPTTTAPTTVTQPTSTPASRSSVATNSRPPNVYIYEPLTPGFDRYDFNTGKKVYTPNSGPSRNSTGQTSVPDSTPRVPSNANAPLNGGIPVGTTTGGPSLLRQRSISQQRRTTGTNTNNAF